jgi:hypothetical protein
MAEPQRVEWSEDGTPRSARWRAESTPVPKRVEFATDATRAAPAFHQVAEGTTLLYRGDYHNARQLLTALSRRVDERRKPPPADLLAAFHAHRQFQSLEHQLLSRLVVPLDADYKVQLKRAPDVREACLEAWGPAQEASLVALRELLGVIGAHEWRKNGIELEALGGRIHPHYGVFGPVRSEYVDLVAAEPLPRVGRAWDVGTGTGVLAILLARRGVPEVLATDAEPRAIACALENVRRFQLDDRIRVEQRDLFPDGKAGLVVFNPPWMPGKPRSPVEHAIYDPDSRTLRRFLAGVASRLEASGEAWVVISNLAELVGLRPEGWLVQEAEKSGLRLAGKSSTPARHPKSQDELDPLFAARSREATTLYRFATK